MAIERDEVYWLNGTIEMLEAQVEGLEYELRVRELRLEEQSKYIAELLLQILHPPLQAVGEGAQERELPAFVKPNVPKRPRKKPGRKAGHEPVFRAVPAKIDHHQEVPLTTDGSRRPLCPGGRKRRKRDRSNYASEQWTKKIERQLHLLPLRPGGRPATEET